MLHLSASECSESSEEFPLSFLDSVERHEYKNHNHVLVSVSNLCFFYLPYRDFFVSTGQVILEGLHVLFGPIHLHSGFL